MFELVYGVSFKAVLAIDLLIQSAILLYFDNTTYVNLIIIITKESFVFVPA